MAVLLITHDLNLVRRFADRVAVMENGHIVEQGAVSTVFGAPQHAYTRKLIDSRPDARRAACSCGCEDAPPVLEAAGAARRAIRCRGPAWPAGSARASSWRCRAPTSALRRARRWVWWASRARASRPSRSRRSACCKHGGSLGVAGQRWNAGGASDRALRRQMQVVFQDPFSSLSPRMTVEQIVGEGLTVHAPGLDTAARAHARARRAGRRGPDARRSSRRCSTAIRTSSRAASASAWRSRAR